MPKTQKKKKEKYLKITKEDTNIRFYYSYKDLRELGFFSYPKSFSIYTAAASGELSLCKKI